MSPHQERQKVRQLQGLIRTWQLLFNNKRCIFYSYKEVHKISVNSTSYTAQHNVHISQLVSWWLWCRYRYPCHPRAAGSYERGCRDQDCAQDPSSPQCCLDRDLSGQPWWAGCRDQDGEAEERRLVGVPGGWTAEVEMCVKCPREPREPKHR